MSWWEPTTGSYTAVAAYRAIGAASLAASYVNLANPGTNDATAPGTAPTFDAADGWTFNGSSDYLTTGLTPGSGWTMLVRYSNRPGGTLTIVGATAAANTAPYFAFVNFGNTPTRQWYMAYGSAGSTAYSNDAASGVLGLAGLNRYFDGTSIGALTGSWSGTPQALLIGGQYNTSPTVYRFWSGKIQAVAIYSTTLDATQMAEISANMAALTDAMLYEQAVAGSLTSAGVVVRATSKAVAGTLTTTGAVVRLTARVLEGALTSAGGVVKSVGKALAGALSTSGTVSTVATVTVEGLVHLTAQLREFALRVRRN